MFATMSKLNIYSMCFTYFSQHEQINELHDRDNLQGSYVDVLM